MDLVDGGEVELVVGWRMNLTAILYVMVTDMYMDEVRDNKGNGVCDSEGLQDEVASHALLPPLLAPLSAEGAWSFASLLFRSPLFGTAVS